MGAPEKLDLNHIVTDICNNLLHNNKLITVKNVYNEFVSIYSTLNTQNTHEYLEENFINSINLWRMSLLNKEGSNFSEIKPFHLNNNHFNDVHSIEANDNVESNSLYKENNALKKELSMYKREIQFLQAKIKSINNCYSRQRKDLIMRIQRMLCQKER